MVLANGKRSTDRRPLTGQWAGVALTSGRGRRPVSKSPIRCRNIHHSRSDGGTVVIAKAVQTQPRPPSNQRTPIHAKKTASHIVEEPITIGVRVSPLPRKPPPLTNQIAQKGSDRLRARNAATPASITSGSSEKTSIICPENRKTTAPPTPSQPTAQRRAISQAVR